MDNPLEFGFKLVIITAITALGLLVCSIDSRLKALENNKLNAWDDKNYFTNSCDQASKCVLFKLNNET